MSRLSSAAGAVPPPHLPGDDDVPAQLRAREQSENFPVALRVLPRDLRADLRAVYDVVRTIDDLGDEHAEQTTQQRTAALHSFAADLAAVWSTGAPQAAVLSRLVPAVRRRNLPQEPFGRLVSANLQDQEVTRYETFEDLLAYCQLSAAPIGELVLTLFGAATPARVALSDRICAGLQVAEHLQDVAEDRRAGRIYLPQADLVAHGVAVEGLDAATASPRLRRLVGAEADRVTALLDHGAPLLRSLSGWARVAVAGYVAGGRAAVDGVHRVDGDVLGATPTVRRRDVARHATAALLAARGAGRC